MSTRTLTKSIAAALPDLPNGARVQVDGATVELTEPATFTRERGTAYVRFTGRTDEGHKVTREILPQSPVTLSHPF